MKKFLIISLIVLLAVSFSVFAQEKKEMKGEKMKADMPEMSGEMPSMTPPKALSSDWYNWMVGEWEGTSKSSMGIGKDWIKFEWGLDNQFVVINYKGKMTEPNKEMMEGMREQMNMSEHEMQEMMEMPYKGMGVVTLNPKTGESWGYWFDNWRSVSKGKGKMEDENKMTMVWEGSMGTETRTTEKVGENKMVIMFKSSGPMGEYEGKTELSRVMGMKPATEMPVQGSGTKAKK